MTAVTEIHSKPVTMSGSKASNLIVSIISFPHMSQKETAYKVEQYK